MGTFFAASAVDKDLKKLGRPIYIIGQLFFKNAVNIGTLKDTVKTKLLAIDRFRCVPKETEEHVYNFTALPVDEINMDYHIKDMTKTPMTQQDVDEFISQIYEGEPGEPTKDINSIHFDYERPAWRFYLIKMQDGRTLLLPFIDHMVVDGVAAVAALMKIVDSLPANAAPPGKRATGPPMSYTGRVHAFLYGVKEVFLGSVLPADKKTCLKEPDHRNPTIAKANALGDKVSLDEMKRIKNKFPGASINDVMLATLTLTMQSYFNDVGQEIIPIRGNFPINIRKPGEDVFTNTLGNNFVPGVFPFPMKETDPVKLIWAIKSQSDTLKASPAPFLSAKVFDTVIPLLTKANKRKELRDVVLDAYGKVTVVFSNVPGPSAEVSMCGQPIDDLMFYAMAPIGCYLGIISYNGKVGLGVTTSKALESDASRLAKQWKPSFEKLVAAVDAAPEAALKTPKTYGDCLVLAGMAVALAGAIGFKAMRKP